MSKEFLYVDTGGYYQESTAYESTDFINATTGAGDAAKPILTDASGVLDSSFIEGYVGDVVSGLEWQDSVLDADTLTPPGSPSTGDRYLINGTGAGGWAGQDDKIAEWDGSAWQYTDPTTGMFVSADDENDLVYYYGGSSWSTKAWENTTASTGLTKSGNDIQLADAAASNGVSVSSGAISAVVDDTTIEINGSEQIAVKADGINDTHIDWGTGSNQISGADIPILDSGNYFTTDFVEDALQELGAAVIARGVVYTAGNNISKGDLCYVSANDTASTYSTITTAQAVIGPAAADATTGNSVTILADDTTVDGFTGLTAGAKYFWTGSGYTTNFGSYSSGDYRYLGGVAKNATTVHTSVEFLGVES
jgi:hypothetical protein